MPAWMERLFGQERRMPTGEPELARLRGPVPYLAEPAVLNLQAGPAVVDHPRGGRREIEPEGRVSEVGLPIRLSGRNSRTC